MKIDEKEIANVMILSEAMSAEDINDFDYFSYILKKLMFEINLKKQKLTELDELEVSSEYPVNTTDTTTSFMNYLSSNGFNEINEKNIMLASKGAAAFTYLEKIVKVIYDKHFTDDDSLKEFIENELENGVA